MDTNCAEDFAYDDEFHRELQDINHSQGAGQVIAIVWSIADAPGTNLTGMAVCQQQSGMTARRFSVAYSKDSFTLKFLGRVKRVASDYFGWTING